MYTRHGLTKDDSELAEPLKGGSATAPRTLGRATLLVTAATVGMLAAFCAGALFASASGPARAGSGAELPVLGGGKPMKVAPAPVASGKRFRTNLAFQDEFDFLDFSKWRHEITMGGGGNWCGRPPAGARPVSFGRRACARPSCARPTKLTRRPTAVARPSHELQGIPVLHQQPVRPGGANDRGRTEPAAGRSARPPRASRRALRARGERRHPLTAARRMPAYPSPRSARPSPSAAPTRLCATARCTSTRRSPRTRSATSSSRRAASSTSGARRPPRSARLTPSGAATAPPGSAAT